MTIPHATPLPFFNFLRFQLRYKCVRAHGAQGLEKGWGRFAGCELNLQVSVTARYTIASLQDIRP